MQFIKLLTAFFIIGLFFYACPFPALADGKSYNQQELASSPIFVSADSKIELSWPKNKYSYLDLYFNLPTEIPPKNITTLSPTYYYYLYSEEVKNDDLIDIKYSTSADKQNLMVFYWSEAKKNYFASPITIINDQAISFTLKGQSNKFFIGAINTVTSKDTKISLPGDLLTLQLPEIFSKQKIQTIIKPINISRIDKKPVSLGYQISFQTEDNQPIDTILTTIIKNYSCSTLLSSTMATTNKNKTAEVKKLQQFLRDNEGFVNLQINGKYDKITAKAVKDFQEKYQAEILKPWGLKEGTGQVQKTTLKKINALACAIAKQDLGKIKISSPYSQANGLAKNWYYLDEQSNSWKTLDSIDNHKLQITTSFFEPKNITIALFEEIDQWVGEASWYAWKNGLFAASRDFPKGTKIKVTNQSEGANKGKSVIVTINDYGPEAWTKRIIDLDKTAYQQLGYLGGGVMPVKIEVVK